MNLSKTIKAAIAYSGKTQSILAKAINTSPQNFSQKLKRGYFSDKEMELIAETLGAKLIPFCFEFPDGKRI